MFQSGCRRPSMEYSHHRDWGFFEGKPHETFHAAPILTEMLGRDDQTDPQLSDSVFHEAFYFAPVQPALCSPQARQSILVYSGRHLDQHCLLPRRNVGDHLRVHADEQSLGRLHPGRHLCGYSRFNCCRFDHQPRLRCRHVIDPSVLHFFSKATFEEKNRCLLCLCDWCIVSG